KNYWNSRYQSQQTGWDVGTVSTPLKAYIDQLEDKNLSILIPGCGNAYEAAYLLQQGFTNITLLDIAPKAVEAFKSKWKEFDGRQLHIICGDFFELNQTFDLVIEQTFFCALHPSLRKDYANKMFDLLNDNGKLAGVLFNRAFEGGPPFGGNRQEYLQIFSAKFNIKIMEDCYNSISPRAGSELFFILKKEA
ncbi:MAG TPA: methyltransferase domain-containing protein, partial [Ferruginibacter sp.]|nr:methyltransferase domain-containing protein [Ferruginibacter sp.]